MIKTAIFLTALCLTTCLSEKNVTILSIYQLNPNKTALNPPPYDLNIVVTGLDEDATLLAAMTKAQNDWEMTFIGTESNNKTLGLFVTTIAWLEAGEKQYWQIQGAVGDAPFTPLLKGVSNYVPVNTEKVLFTLVSWGGGNSGIVDTDGGKSGGSVINPGFRLFTTTLLASLILLQY